MKKFGGKIIFLNRDNINTDEIIPAKYLTEIDKEPLKAHLLEDLKIDELDPSRVKWDEYGAVISKSNLVKKLMGFNIMETSVFLFFISIGAVEGGKAPIIIEASSKTLYVNPLPQALILTGIVVAVSTTALALSLIIKIFEHCKTIEADKLKEMEE